MITCPYHKDGQERRPSAGVKKEDGTFHCFTCGEVHSLPEVISFCFDKNDLFGTFGWEWLIKNFAVVSVENRNGVDIDLSRDKKEKPIKYVTEEELEEYRYYHPYMWARGLTREIVEIFDVGYDKETDCLTFPVRDINGNCLFIARRSVRTKFFNYPSNVKKPIYGLFELNKIYPNCPDVIVCESMIDALTCWVYGKYAVAMNGLGNDLQFEQLRNLKCRHLILATDNDEAGLKARKRIVQNVKNKIITEYILPSNRKDINELSEEEFGALQERFITN